MKSTCFMHRRRFIIEPFIQVPVQLILGLAPRERLQSLNDRRSSRLQNRLRFHRNCLKLERLFLSKPRICSCYHRRSPSGLLTSSGRAFDCSRFSFGSRRLRLSSGPAIWGPVCCPGRSGRPNVSARSRTVSRGRRRDVKPAIPGPCGRGPSAWLSLKCHRRLGIQSILRVPIQFVDCAK